MFNIGFGELVVVLLIAFLVVGPEDLPKMARTLAKGIKGLKRMMGDLKEELAVEDDGNYIKEIKDGIAETKKLAEEYHPVKAVKKELASLDPLHDVKQDLNLVQKEMESLKKGIKK